MDKQKAKELVEDLMLLTEHIKGFDDGDEERILDVRSKAREVLEELSKSDWISIEYEKPELEEAVLVTSKNDPNEMYFAHRTERKDVIVDDNLFTSYKNAEPITHWQKINKLEE